MVGNAAPGAQIEEEFSAGARLGRVRWSICAMLFAATSINYMDRQVISILKPTLEHSIGMTEVGYSYIVDAFQVAYAFGLLAAGRFVDRVGTRIGYMVIMAVWSLSAMGHALANTVLEFGIARFSLGLGEAGNFPAALKTVAEWFPQSERSLATGIFNHRAVGDDALWLACGLSGHWRIQRDLDSVVVQQIPQTHRPSHTHRRGVAPHLPGSRCRDGPLHAVAQPTRLPPDLGVFGRQVSYRSGLVVLSLLDALLLQCEIPSEPFASGDAADHRL